LAEYPELWEVLENIDNAIETILADTEFSPEVRSIIIGDRTRVGDAKPPGIWVFTDDSTISHAGSSLSEEWTLRLVVAATYMDKNPDTAKRNSIKLASQASAALIKESRTISNNVRDLVRTGYQPGMPRIEGNNTLYGTGIEMEARFRFFEPGQS
jgi:hypothetical protein